MRVVVVVLVALLIYLQSILWFGKGGIRDEQLLERDVVKLQAEILALKERNQTLAAEVLDLKQGLEAIEELARTEMGMVKDGELFFQLVKPPQQNENQSNDNVDEQ
ncbi:MAG: cell division protein FtsB [Gammaproteobacteria bacterium]